MKRNFIKLTAIVLAFSFLFTSCASIVSSSTYPLSINSNPSNAKVTVTNKNGYQVYMGRTPATVQLRAGNGFFAKAEYQVRFSSEGYEDKVVPVTFKIDGWYFGNILIGGLLGMLVIDPITGAMWKIDNKYMNETLSPTAGTTAEVKPEMKIMDINDVPDSLKSHLVKVN